MLVQLNTVQEVQSAIETVWEFMRAQVLNGNALRQQDERQYEQCEQRKKIRETAMFTLATVVAAMVTIVRGAVVTSANVAGAAEHCDR